MKHLKKFSIAIILTITATFLSCSSDDDNTNNEPVGVTEINSTVYDLEEVANSGVSGTAKFIEYSDASLSVELDVQNTSAGNTHPAHIHFNSAAEGGGIALSLEPIDGATGNSTTTFTALNDGTPITYNQLIDFNGYINVHLSPTDLATLVAQGNIGSNVGNNESKTYDVTNNGATDYVFNGEEFSNTSNPNLTFVRGGTYTFNVNTPGHPFLINSVQGTGPANTYSSGVTNNGAVSGSITFTVPANAPNTLFYNCEFHGSMTGTITITD